MYQLYPGDFLGPIRYYRGYTSPIITEFQYDIPIILTQANTFLSAKTLYNMLNQIGVIKKPYDELYLDLGHVCLKNHLKCLVQENFKQLFPILSQYARTNFQLLIKYFNLYYKYIKTYKFPELEPTEMQRINSYLFNGQLNIYFAFFLFSLFCGLLNQFDVVSAFKNDQNWLGKEPVETASKDTDRAAESRNGPYHNDVSIYPAYSTTEQRPLSQEDLKTSAVYGSGNRSYIPDPYVPILKAQLQQARLYSEAMATQHALRARQHEDEVRQLNGRIAGLKTDLVELYQLARQYETAVLNQAQYQRRIGELSQENQEYLAQNRQLHAIISRMKEYAHDLQLSIARGEEAERRQNSELAGYKREVAGLRAKLQQLDAGDTGPQLRHAAKQQLQRFKQGLAAQNAEIQRLQERLGAADEERRQLRAELQARDALVQQLRTEADAQASLARRQQDELNEQKMEINRNQASAQQVEALEQYVRELRADVAARAYQAEELAVCRARLEEAGKQRRELQTQVDSLLTEAERLRGLGLDNERYRLENQYLHTKVDRLLREAEEHTRRVYELYIENQYLKIAYNDATSANEAAALLKRDLQTQLQKNAFLSQQVRAVQRYFTQLHGWPPDIPPPQPPPDGAYLNVCD